MMNVLPGWAISFRGASSVLLQSDDGCPPLQIQGPRHLLPRDHNEHAIRWLGDGLDPIPHIYLGVLYRKFETCLSVFLSVCLPPLKRNLRPSQTLVPNRPRRRPDVDVFTTRIDSGPTYKQSGPTSGFNGTLRLELRDPAPPAFLSHVDNRLFQSWREQRNISQINWLQRVDRNKSKTTLYKHGLLRGMD